MPPLPSATPVAIVDGWVLFPAMQMALKPWMIMSLAQMKMPLIVFPAYTHNGSYSVTGCHCLTLPVPMPG